MGETSVWEPEGTNQDRTDFKVVRRSTPPTCGWKAR